MGPAKSYSCTGETWFLGYNSMCAWEGRAQTRGRGGSLWGCADMGICGTLEQVCAYAVWVLGVTLCVVGVGCACAECDLCVEGV